VKRVFLSIVFVLLCLTIAGCSDGKKGKDITDFYTVTENDDYTYSYSFSDTDGNILFENKDAGREPKINRIASAVYELITQSGTGRSTNWAVYCDVENGKTSDMYYHVLASKENYVICGDLKNGEYFITVQEIFEKNGDRYYKEYKLENVSTVAADFVTGCIFDDSGNIVVTYLTGSDYTETDLMIVLP